MKCGIVCVSNLFSWHLLPAAACSCRGFFTACGCCGCVWLLVAAARQSCCLLLLLLRLLWLLWLLWLRVASGCWWLLCLPVPEVAICACLLLLWTFCHCLWLLLPWLLVAFLGCLWRADLRHIPQLSISGFLGCSSLCFFGLLDLWNSGYFVFGGFCSSITIQLFQTPSNNFPKCKHNTSSKIKRSTHPNFAETWREGPLRPPDALCQYLHVFFL